MISGANTSNQLSQKGLVGIDRRAMGRMGRQFRRPNEGVRMIRVSSSAVRGKKLPLLDERSFAEKFSPVVEDLNTHRVSRATGCSVETVKAWRARRAFPNGASLINAARAFPSVKTWLLQQIEAQEEESGDITKMLASLNRLANSNGPYAGMAAAILQEMHKPRGGLE